MKNDDGYKKHIHNEQHTNETIRIGEIPSETGKRTD